MIAFTKIVGAILLCLSVGACTTAHSYASTQHGTLTEHNQLRALHHAPSLRWNKQLAAYATQYAARCEFKHSHGPYGENLAAGYSSTAEAIKAWYGEAKKYDYQQPEFSYQTGHFTQLVWKSSTELGCALAICNGKHGTPGKFLVCEYNPPGNVTNAGYFARNVQ